MSRPPKTALASNAIVIYVANTKYVNKCIFLLIHCSIIVIVSLAFSIITENLLASYTLAAGAEQLNNGQIDRQRIYRSCNIGKLENPKIEAPFGGPLCISYFENNRFILFVPGRS